MIYTKLEHTERIIQMRLKGSEISGGGKKDSQYNDQDNDDNNHHTNDDCQLPVLPPG